MDRQASTGDGPQVGDLNRISEEDKSETPGEEIHRAEGPAWKWNAEDLRGRRRSKVSYITKSLLYNGAQSLV